VVAWRRFRLARAAASGFGLFVLVAVIGGVLLSSPLQLPARHGGVQFLDRHGVVFAERPSAARGFGMWRDRHSSHVVLATLAAEDHRFPDHLGLDPLGICRAIVADIRAGRAAQGASTITQQLARVLWKRPPGLPGKVVEAWWALRLERALSKNAILGEYLNRVYYGDHAYGIEAAARTYLDKAASELSIAEAALLAALPRRPTALNPWRRPERARAARDRVINRLEDLEWISPATAAQARAQRLGLRRSMEWSHAPHLVRRLPRRSGAVRTTLDLGIQQRVQAIAADVVAQLVDKQVSQASVMVVENSSAQVLAYLGSVDWSGPGGQVDGARARRSSGSALKPFTYWLGLERGATEGGITLATVLADLPGSWSTSHGTWTPRNYDPNYSGPVTARAALARSLNLPAARLLDRLGAAELHRRLSDLGLSSIDQRPDHYGLGLTLGNGEVRLDELVAAYLALGSGGRYRPLVYERGDAVGRPGRQVGDEAAAWLVLDALDDANARAPAFGVDSALEPSTPLAAKTGTSVGFRDNWAMGLTTNYTVGVWVGNFDASPMGRVSGVTGAGPILRAIVDELSSGRQERWPRPPQLVSVKICPLSGKRRSQSCPGSITEHFLPDTAPTDECSWHREIEVDSAGALATGCPGAHKALAIAWPAGFSAWAAEHDVVGWPRWDRSCVASAPHAHANSEASEGGLQAPQGAQDGVSIAWPPNGVVFHIDPRSPAEHQAVPLRANVGAGTPEVTWSMDGAEIARVRAPYSARWIPVPGEHTIGLGVAGQVVAKSVVWVGGGGTVSLDEEQ
jgi:penicillin-binding protein 1C